MNTGARLTTLTRLGFAVRGALYIVIALLILRTGRAEDPAGALAYLGEGGGRLLLGLMAAGLLGYGIWRLADAVLNIERHGSDRKGAFERIGAAASGAVHLFLTWQAARLIQGVARAGDGAEQGARTALALPGGGALVMLVGALLAAVGVVQLAKAAKGSFLRYLDPAVASKRWARWSGRAGYAARGTVFLISAWFLVRAGIEARASAAAGMAEVLAWLERPFDVVVALGLLAFGLFGLIEARFRRLHDVPVEGLMGRATAR